MLEQAGTDGGFPGLMAQDAGLENSLTAGPVIDSVPGAVPYVDVAGQYGYPDEQPAYLAGTGLLDQNPMSRWKVALVVTIFLLVVTAMIASLMVVMHRGKAVNVISGTERAVTGAGPILRVRFASVELASTVPSSPASAELVPAALSSPASADNSDLGTALVSMMTQGLGLPAGADADGAASCLASAVSAAGVGPGGQAALVKLAGTSWGGAVAALRAQGATGTDLLLSDSLLSQMGACVSSSLSAVPVANVFPAPLAPSLPLVQSRAQVLVPAYDVSDGNTPEGQPPVVSQDDISKGLSSMLSSFARDDNEKAVYEAAADCIAAAVMAPAGPAGVTGNGTNGPAPAFSPAAQAFLAGGAPLGAGSVAKALPSAADTALWKSDGFRGQMAACVSTAQRDVTAAGTGN